MNSLFKKLRLAYLEDMINDPEVQEVIGQYFKTHNIKGGADGRNIKMDLVGILTSRVGEKFRYATENWSPRFNDVNHEYAGALYKGEGFSNFNEFFLITEDQKKVSIPTYLYKDQILQIDLKNRFILQTWDYYEEELNNDEGE